MGEVIEWEPKPVAVAKCSFCGKPENKVKRLIGEAGYAHICDKCLARCTELLKEES